MEKIVGLSLSCCIRDLVEKQGREIDVIIGFDNEMNPIREKRILDLVKVEKIISGTNARNHECFKENVLKTYIDISWRENPFVSCFLANLFWMMGKIEQPREEGRYPKVFYGHWALASIPKENLTFNPDETEKFWC